jgi:preprotein translocase subunit YajC
MGIATLAVFVGLFYLLLWFPQAKRAKAHRNLMGSLQKGDEVMTSGGMLGKISKIEDNFITLTVSPNVDITLQKDSVAAQVPKGTLK